ncbi:MAG: hypothetical protein HZC29_08855 [Thaumarchaeota archaeon]|nr:hypothetical protein [Nitrososphaerota archaeon]
MTNQIIPHSDGQRLAKRTLLERRLDGRVAEVFQKYLAPYARNLEVLPLRPHTAVEIAGQERARVTFMGMDKGRLLYETDTSYRVIGRKLEKSWGLRFDIYHSDFWTRTSVTELFGAYAGNGFNPSAVSRFQAMEVAVHDKKTGGLYVNWYSIGANKDRVAEPNGQPFPSQMMRRAEDRSGGYGQRQIVIVQPVIVVQQTDVMTARPAFQPAPAYPQLPAPKAEPVYRPEDFDEYATVASISISEAQRTTKQALARIGMEAVTSLTMLGLHNETIGIGTKPAAISRENGHVLVSYTYRGDRRTDIIGIEQSKQQRGHELVGLYRAVFHTYEVDNPAGAHEKQYLVVANVFSPRNELYCTFALGTRGISN